MDFIHPAGKNDSGALNPPRQRLPEHRAAIDKRIAQTSTKYKGVMRKALDGSAAPRAAIKAFCIHCVGDVRAEVTRCSAFACPLWLYRPYQNAAEPEDVEIACPAP